MTKHKHIQLLHTSDVHGYVYPTSYVSGAPQSMGLAKLFTLIEQIRKPDSFLIDTGDTIQGSPLTYYVQRMVQPDIHPLAIAMNYMKYDYVSIGNHEFNYGLRNLYSFVDNIDATILNCNLLNDSTKQPCRGVSYDVVTLEDGPTIGFIGATTHYIPNWEQPSHIAHLSIEDAFESIQKTVAIIKDHVDFIIVNYHGGFERDFETDELTTEDTGENQGSKILTYIPEIDVLLTGHQHRSLLGSTYNTFYSQPGFNAQSVTEILIDFTYDSAWTYTITGSKHPITNQEPNQEIVQLLQDTEEGTQSYLDTPVGTMDDDLLITDQLACRVDKHPLVSLINHVQLEYTEADISSCSLGNHVSGFRKEITIRDVIGTYIFPNTLVVKEMTGRDITQAIEKTAEFFTIRDNDIAFADGYYNPKLQLYAYDMYDPLEYTLTISNPPGLRVSNLSLHGQLIEEDKTYSVVMNNYRASGGGDYLFIKNCPTINDTQKEVIELLIDYIMEHRHITIPHKNNITIKK